ncbi:uncharacterized protein LOC103932190 isoform X2 [Pyrus x bretschneideri]|uniref:uncharacterized protein LOC103932190 isoform X2 n=1 Tax=Pyrus x bretschneideri TaxID=225117 RepID=UPI0020304797|nr:uncharacterized protein LOC103932190 isoform X2 [Pyrus x bretschneideri]
MPLLHRVTPLLPSSVHFNGAHPAATHTETQEEANPRPIESQNPGGGFCGAQSRMTSWRDLGSHLHQKEDTCHPILVPLAMYFPS